jgi:hypothetical protein
MSLGSAGLRSEASKTTRKTASSGFRVATRMRQNGSSGRFAVAAPRESSSPFDALKNSSQSLWELWASAS